MLPNGRRTVPRPRAEINQLGKYYSETHDRATLLELCEAFHPYLMKYLVMICRGHVPVVGVGKNPFSINPASALARIYPVLLAKSDPPRPRERADWRGATPRLGARQMLLGARRRRPGRLDRFPTHKAAGGK